MGKVFETIGADLTAWIQKQKMFFVATAPLSGDGFVNCSPKGGDTFRILNGNEVAYQDFTGSGVETIAHLQENGRIVVMFCGFEGPPKIVRLRGQGTVITEDHSEYPSLIGEFPQKTGTRSIIHINVNRIADSCGYSVPLYDFKAPREILDNWAADKGAEGVKNYQQENNLASLDGLPGLKTKR